MESIIELDVKEVLVGAEKKGAFDKYAKIAKTFKAVDVSKNREFQKTYNGFYRIRRNVEWQTIYYSMMECCKDKKGTFEELLGELYVKTGRVEASFVSKLLHTIDDKMPILDKFVLQNLNKKMPLCSGEKKLEKCIALYEEIVDWYTRALGDIEIGKKLAEFDRLQPQYAWFSQTKKLDFLLWQMR